LSIVFISKVVPFLVVLQITR